jgi:hypothetical protein
MAWGRAGTSAFPQTVRLETAAPPRSERRRARRHERRRSFPCAGRTPASLHFRSQRSSRYECGAVVPSTARNLVCRLSRPLTTVWGGGELLPTPSFRAQRGTLSAVYQGPSLPFGAGSSCCRHRRSERSEEPCLPFIKTPHAVWGGGELLPTPSFRAQRGTLTMRAKVPHQPSGRGHHGGE